MALHMLLGFAAPSPPAPWHSDTPLPGPLENLCKGPDMVKPSLGSQPPSHSNTPSGKTWVGPSSGHRVGQASEQGWGSWLEIRGLR